MKPAIEDVANRRPVWDALSDLFLDDELQPSDFEHIAQTLAASPYLLEEIENTLYGEVYPICIWNMLSVAGEWGMFDGDRLQAAILRRQQRWVKIPRFLQMGRWMVRKPWQQIKKLIQERRERVDGL
jgi:hypothetical protein